MKKYNISTTDSDSVLGQIQRNAGYWFKNRSLLNEALTHSSYAAEHPEEGPCNERLEFLGDAILQIIVSDYIYRALPSEQEGVLTRLRSSLTNETANTNYTRRLGLDVGLLLGHGEILTGGREQSSILGDVFEAFLGAVYLDGGMPAATSVVMALLPPLESCLGKLAYEENPKGTLLQWTQAQYKMQVTYRVVKQDGPVHNPVFTVEALLDGKVIGTAVGHSHKEAERGAALAALHTLGVIQRGETAQGPVNGAGGPSGPSLAPAVIRPSDTKAAETTRIIALDFDGVLCDSVTETAMSMWRAARVLWPDMFRRKDITQKALAAFRQVRPYLETGWQGILILRYLQQGKDISFFQRDLQEKIQQEMARTGTTEAQLKKLLSDTRTAWMESDEEGWMAVNGFYPGVIDALRTAMTRHHVYILTTKQERFVKALLLHAGVDFSINSIYGLDRKLSKDTMLAQFAGSAKTNVHFFEDRLETLLRVKACKALSRVKLHLVPWGYVAPEQLEQAVADSRIDVVTEASFAALLS